MRFCAAIFILYLFLLITACSSAPKTKYTTGDCMEQSTVFKFMEHVATLETGEAIYRIEVLRTTEVKVVCPDRERPIHEFHGRDR